MKCKAVSGVMLTLIIIGILTGAPTIQLVGSEVGAENENGNVVPDEVATLNSFPGMPPIADCFGTSIRIPGVEGAFAVVATDNIGGVYVAYQSHWIDGSSPYVHVYFAYSHDYGKSWSESFRVDDNGSSSVQCDTPSIAVDQLTGNIFVAWKDNRTGVAKVYIDKSVNRGLSFGPDVTVYDWPLDLVPMGLPYTVNVKVGDDGTIYVVWIAYHSYSYTDCDIFFTRSIDGGQTFSSPAIVNPEEGEARLVHPWIAIDGESVLYVVYAQRNSSFSAVYLSRSLNKGSSFEAPVKVSDDSTLRYRGGTQVNASPDGKIHVVWTDGRAGDGPQYLDIYCATSLDSGSSFGSNVRVNDDHLVVPPDVHPHFTRGVQGTPSIATDSDSRVHVVWEDFRNFVNETTYCRDTYYASSEDGTRFSKNIRVNYVHPDADSVNNADPSMIIDFQDNLFMVYSDAPSGDNDHHQIYFTFAPSSKWKWTKFRHDAGNTGFSPSTAPRINNTRWSYVTSGAVESSPAVVEDMVFVGASNKVYAVRKTNGEFMWNFTADDLIKASPAVADGIVFVSSIDKNVYALNETNGNLIWNYTTGNAVVSSPSIAEGIAFTGSNDSNLYALNQTNGQLVWNFTTGSPVDNSPAVVDGLVFIGSGNKMYALNVTTGDIFWQQTYTSTSSPAIADGLVFFGSNAGVFSLKETNGDFFWEASIGMAVYSSPAIAYGKVFFGCEDNKVYALNQTNGSILWQYATNDSVYSSPAVVDGVVFIGSGDGKLYALNETNGQLVWKYATQGDVYSSPAVADGQVYVGSCDGNLYAFGEVCDVAVTNVTVPRTIVSQDYCLDITITTANQGNHTETFNVSVYVNTTEIETQEIIVSSGNSIIITFTWNTTGWDKGNYTVSANASTVSGETDTTDNIYVDGTVRVNMAGDVAPEFGLVDIVDIVYVAIHFGAEKGQPQYEPNADINGDGIIDIVDIVIIAIHFGETDP